MMDLDQELEIALACLDSIAWTKRGLEIWLRNMMKTRPWGW